MSCSSPFPAGDPAASHLSRPFGSITRSRAFVVNRSMLATDGSLGVASMTYASSAGKRLKLYSYLPDTLNDIAGKRAS